MLRIQYKILANLSNSGCHTTIIYMLVLACTCAYFFVPCSVMQKELDKIERFASEVTEKSKMNRASADNLLASVKVNKIYNIVNYYHNYSIVCRHLYQAIENNFMNWTREVKKWMKHIEIYW